jgi:hypothetical protein
LRRRQYRPHEETAPLGLLLFLRADPERLDSPQFARAP